MTPLDPIALGKAVRKRHGALRNQLTYWKPKWKQLAQVFSPWRFRALDDGAKPNQNRRQNRNNTGWPVIATRSLASGMHSGMTSPARPWFRLGMRDPTLEDISAVRTWLGSTTTVIRDVLNKTNFYDQMALLYTELATFGTGVILMPEDNERGRLVFFETLTAGEYCLTTDSTGRVNGVYRQLSMTADHMVERFGREACSTTVQQAYDKEETRDNFFTVNHAIFKNPAPVEGRLDWRGKPWLSVYLEHAGSQDVAPLEVAGYAIQPFAAPRWEVVGHDVYGRGPSWDALEDAKELNAYVRAQRRAVDLSNLPPYAVPSTMRNEALNLAPGGVNFIDFTNGGQIKPLLEQRPDLAGTNLVIQDLRAAVDAAMYRDLFVAIGSIQRSGMTAREVDERVEEKLTMLGPIVERLHSELLTVVIDRVFNLAYDARIIPPPPDELQGQEYAPEYISMLAAAQKLVGQSSTREWVAFLMQWAQIVPAIVDNIDFDKIASTSARDYGLPPDYLRDGEEVAAMRQGRAQAQQEAAAAAQQAQAAKTMRDLGSTPLGQQSTALEAMTGGLMQ